MAYRGSACSRGLQGYAAGSLWEKALRGQISGRLLAAAVGRLPGATPSCFSHKDQITGKDGEHLPSSNKFLNTRKQGARAHQHEIRTDWGVRMQARFHPIFTNKLDVDMRILRYNNHNWAL